MEPSATRAPIQCASRERFATATGQYFANGDDEYAVILIALADAYGGATRRIHLQIPAFDGQGVLEFSDRHLNVRIPKGVREGHHLRLKGHGVNSRGRASAGDLYLEVIFMPHRLFRLDTADVYLDLPVTTREAALGATITVPTPTGTALLTIPPGSANHRRLRLQGHGLPGSPPGDLYAVLDITQPPDDGMPAQQS